MRKPLVVLAGPTAVGKTELSIELAKAINGEIISADSMQVYRYMDIGSAKIKEFQMQGIKHYLIDEFQPDDEFNVAIFQKRAKQCIREIYNKGKIPILTGGTGFYIQSVVYDINFTETETDTSYREELEQIFRAKGAEFLHRILWEIDSKAADEIHANNVKRVIRALEYNRQTGEKISEHNQEERNKISPYNLAYFAIVDERLRVYERINQRVDFMLQEGLVEEVIGLKEKGYTRDLVSMQGLGYKEIFSYLEGEYLLEEAIDKLKRDTRHFAKRQLTWLRRERDVSWIDRQLYPGNMKLLEKIIAELKHRNIL